MFNKYWFINELYPVALLIGLYLFLVHLCIILILVSGVYIGLSGRVRTVYLFSLCVVSLLSSRFNDSALVWIYIFLSLCYSTL
jgi:hypothetical protein